MSQNNDQGRQDPSQPWYDNGEVPQSKKFPFGTGGENADGSTQHGTAQQGNYDQQQSQPQPGQERYVDQPTGEQNQGGQHNQYQPPQSGGNQQFGGDQQGDDPRARQGQYGQQGQYSQQGQYDQQHQHDQQAQYDQQGQQPHGDQNQNQQYPVSGGQHANDPTQQPFQGILDPHTGEIHPVPDLDGLQDTDALLVVVSGPDSGSQILLDTDVVTVGRSPNADIFLDDVTVSRKHAEFIRTPSGFTLRDTGSLNGTYVGRQLIDSIELQNGADVQIGKFRMIFQQRPRS